MGTIRKLLNYIINFFYISQNIKCNCFCNTVKLYCLECIDKDKYNDNDDYDDNYDNDDDYDNDDNYDNDDYEND